MRGDRLREPRLVLLEKISSSLDCEDEELRDRDPSSKRKSRVTTYYRALHSGHEWAFVALDRPPDCEALVIYELYVASHGRNQGRGKSVLKAVEEMAKREGLERTYLIPHSLDGDFPLTRLIAWYERLGYRPRLNDPSGYEKILKRE